MVDMTHERARDLIELWLESKGRRIAIGNTVLYKREFIEKHKLEKRFKGHSFDIWTDKEIIEITDYGKHSKTNQKINDGVVRDYVETYLPKWPFYVLQKEEIVMPDGFRQPTAAQYLKENLF